MDKTERRIVKPTRTTVNRFQGRPGGTALDRVRQVVAGSDNAGADSPGETQGSDKRGGGLSSVIANVTNLAVEAGLMVLPDVEVAGLAPHPWNNPRRSEPQPGNSKWDDLLESVRENGVKMPGLAVTREAFVKAHPELDDTIPDNVTHVLIYGHRRRAAAIEAGQPTMPLIIDDSVVEDGLDLDLMTWENWGRDDPDPVDLAHQFALYSEKYDLGQRGIATRVGVSQSKVSRILSINLLILEAQQAVRTNKLGVTEAAKIASDLPFGPVRRWQEKDKSPIDRDQDTEQRADEQRAVVALIADGMTAARAVARVIAERKARAQAIALGIELVEDPVSRFGEQYDEYRIAGPDEDSNLGEVVAAIDPDTGTLAFYATEQTPTTNDVPSSPDPKPKPKPGVAAEKVDAKTRAVAQKARRAAVAQLAARGAGREKLSGLLFAQYRHRISAADNSKAWAMAHAWLRSADLVAADTVETWQQSVISEPDAKVFQRAIWAVALAAAELRVSDKAHEWDNGDAEFLGLLAEVEDFTPTAWEAERLRAVRKAG
ncbi:MULTISPECIES: hypothetical protein [unclassified Nocardia]|uniref:ParB/RepB/Spo0J family partition protein n=1 Tax=unclassified Nocardia TaxID=2637762 RepID=UPI001CE3D15A|nr:MULTISPECIES: hypothetical protein [unclassified Nocardia]